MRYPHAVLTVCFAAIIASFGVDSSAYAQCQETQWTPGFSTTGGTVDISGDHMIIGDTNGARVVVYSWNGSAWSATAGSPFLTPSVSGSSLIVLYNNPDDPNFISNVVESAVVSSDETLISNGYLINFSATTSRVTIIFYKDGAQITDLSTLPAGIELNIKVNFQRP